VLLAVIFFVAAILFVAKAGLGSRHGAIPGVANVPASPEAPPTFDDPIPDSTPSAPVPSPGSDASVAKKTESGGSPRLTTPPVKPPIGVSPSGGTPVVSPASSVGVKPPPERPIPQQTKGTLIFVFDDAGHNLRQLEPFLKLPFPVTIAVLPGLEYSQRAANEARAAGKEVILHQPMQAINLSYDPGPGAIRQGMTADAIRATVRKNLDEVGPVAGLNNHEGSLITSNAEAMGAVLDVVRERGIYFLDSRTIADTAAPAVAMERNMKIWERAVFLDNIQERESIIEAVYNGLNVAERKGAAIMIGHIWSNDLAEILSDMYPDLVSQGFSLSTIAHIAINDEENR